MPIEIRNISVHPRMHIHLHHWFFIAFVSIAILGIGQDFIHSIINKNAFYLSESSLFRIHWLLLIPIFWIVFFRQKVMRSNIFSIRWLQISLGPTILSLLHLGIASLLVYVLSDIFLDHYYHPLGVFRYFMAEDFYLIWLVYLISFLMLRFDQQTSLEKPTTGIRSMIQVSSKNKMIQVPVTEINCIQSERPYLAIVTSTEKYLHHTTLKKMLAQLDPNCFVRIHRSSIINLRHVVSSQSRANGDYDILLTNGHRIRLSRNYLKDFRLKMDRFTQVSL